ncbi:MAG TPA: 1,4-alpha-glucan branching enzyme, partial [Erysipelothrix sp.]|nr:1,4-alpha-glucan branching enzyme [Erysipelothrix sp.]
MRDLRDNLLDEIIKFNEGKHYESYKFFGNHQSLEDDTIGYRFTVWAPRAKQVSIVGDFNDWNPEPMEEVYESGVWSLFKANVYPTQKYKYHIESHDGQINLKIDPFANQYETPPKDASLVTKVETFEWSDHDYLNNRHDA